MAPTGLLGLTPLASLADFRVGPGSLEQSSVVLPEVLMALSPVQSVLQRRLVLQLHAPKAQVCAAHAGSDAPQDAQCMTCRKLCSDCFTGVAAAACF